MSTKRYELDRDRGFLEQPAELARGTLQWSSLTDLNVVVIDDNFSTHALVDQDGRRVRVVSADTDWIPKRMRDRPVAAG